MELACRIITVCSGTIACGGKVCILTTFQLCSMGHAALHSPLSSAYCIPSQ